MSFDNPNMNEIFKIVSAWELKNHITEPSDLLTDDGPTVLESMISDLQTMESEEPSSNIRNFIRSQRLRLETLPDILSSDEDLKRNIVNTVNTVIDDVNEKFSSDYNFTLTNILCESIEVKSGIETFIDDIGGNKKRKTLKIFKKWKAKQPIKNQSKLAGEISLAISDINILINEEHIKSRKNILKELLETISDLQENVIKLEKQYEKDKKKLNQEYRELTSTDNKAYLTDRLSSLENQHDKIMLNYVDEFNNFIISLQNYLKTPIRKEYINSSSDLSLEIEDFKKELYDLHSYEVSYRQRELLENLYDEVLEIEQMIENSGDLDDIIDKFNETIDELNNYLEFLDGLLNSVEKLIEESRLMIDSESDLDDKSRLISIQSILLKIKSQLSSELEDASPKLKPAKDILNATKKSIDLNTGDVF